MNAKELIKRLEELTPEQQEEKIHTNTDKMCVVGVEVTQHAIVLQCESPVYLLSGLALVDVVCGPVPIP